MNDGTLNAYAFVATEIIKAAVMMMLAVWLFFDTIAGFIVLAPYALFSIYRIARKTGERQRKLLILQFRDVLGCLLTALEAGYSIEKAVGSAKNDMLLLHGSGAVMVKELSKMERRLSLSENIEEIISDFAESTGVAEIENFSDMFTVAKRSGGDIIALIHAANRDMYEKLELQRETESIIAAAVNESFIMKLMPLAILFYMRLGNGEFMSVLYTTLTGRLCMTIVAVLYFVFSEYIDRLVASVGR